MSLIYAPKGEKNLDELKVYFDEIYIYSSDTMLEVDGELSYGTAFRKTTKSTKNNFIFFQDPIMTNRLYKSQRYGDTSFSVYFEKTENGYKKYLFVSTHADITIETLPCIMRYYFRANRRIDYKAFDQRKIQNEFIAQFVSYYSDTVGKLYQGILSMSISDDHLRMLRIEDGESLNSVEFNDKDCEEISKFYKNISNILKI